MKFTVALQSLNHFCQHSRRGPCCQVLWECNCGSQTLDNHSAMTLYATHSLRWGCHDTCFRCQDSWSCCKKCQPAWSAHPLCFRDLFFKLAILFFYKTLEQNVAQKTYWISRTWNNENYEFASFYSSNEHIKTVRRPMSYYVIVVLTVSVSSFWCCYRHNSIVPLTTPQTLSQTGNRHTTRHSLHSWAPM